MNLESLLNRLIREGKIKKQSTTPSQLNHLLDAARRNFKAAEIMRGKIDEAAFKLAYDGLLQIGRLILLTNGYRPDDGEQHKTTFLVAGEILGSEFKDLIDKTQKFRIKRNQSIYNPRGLIGSKDTEAILLTAQNFWRQVKAYLKDRHPQLDLFEEF
jgi:hypothetical protein